MQTVWDTALVELQIELWVAGPETSEQALTLCTTRAQGPVA